MEDLASQTHPSSFEHVHSPLLSSVVHQSFAHAVQQLGCRPLERTVFIQQVRLYLLEHPKGLGENAADYARMWQSVLHGHVLAVEPLPEGPMIFLVRSRLHQSFVDWRLVYQRDTWAFQGITSVHQFPWYRRPWLGWTSAVTAVLVAGLLGFGAAPRAANLDHKAVSKWAEQHGYVLEPINLALTLPQTQVKSGNLISGHASDAYGSARGTPLTQAATASASVSKTGSMKATRVATNSLNKQSQPLKFQLKPGMSLHEMSLFLANNHLVPSAIWFDMQLKNAKADMDVRPGTYVFQSHMSVPQLIQVVRNGPKA